MAQCPKVLRNYMTDYLQFVSNSLDIYKPVIYLLEKGLDSAGNSTIVDIASGGGGGLIGIARHLMPNQPGLKIILTDYYPNEDAFRHTKEKLPEIIEYIDTAVDARQVPPHLRGFRTQFLSLHHFRPADAAKILQDAVTKKQPIGIFEGQQRNLRSFISIMFSPLFVLLLTPFITPFKLGRFFFTYLFPILPLLILWDGIVSVLRSYTVEELKDMTSLLQDTESFTWDIGIVNGKGAILYLLGLPKGSILIPSLHSYCYKVDCL